METVKIGLRWVKLGEIEIFSDEFGSKRVGVILPSIFGGREMELECCACWDDWLTLFDKKTSKEGKLSIG